MIVFILTFIVNFIIALPFIAIVLDFVPVHWHGLNWLMQALEVPIQYHEEMTVFVITLLTLIIPIFLSYLRPFQYLLCLMNGCKSPSLEEKNFLNAMIHFLCSHTGKDPNSFHLYVLNTEELNACAIGNNNLCVTRGLLRCFTPQEVAGVLAHELGHLHNNDTIYSAAIYAMSLVTRAILLCYIALLHILRILTWLPVIGYVALFFFYIFKIQLYTIHFLLSLPLTLISLFSSRRQEYAADRYACEIGLSEELHDALCKLAHYYGVEKLGFFERLRATHPDLDKRIERIRKWTYKNGT